MLLFCTSMVHNSLKCQLPLQYLTAEVKVMVHLINLSIVNRLIFLSIRINLLILAHFVPGDITLFFVIRSSNSSKLPLLTASKDS